MIKWYGYLFLKGCWYVKDGGNFFWLSGMFNWVDIRPKYLFFAVFRNLFANLELSLTATYWTRMNQQLKCNGNYENQSWRTFHAVSSHCYVVYLGGNAFKNPNLALFRYFLRCLLKCNLLKLDLNMLKALPLLLPCHYKAGLQHLPYCSLYSLAVALPGVGYLQGWVEVGDQFSSG